VLWLEPLITGLNGESQRCVEFQKEKDGWLFLANSKGTAGVPVRVGNITTEFHALWVTQATALRQCLPQV
jgi:hypothetical protein